MAFFPLLAKAKSLAHAIYKFQYNIGNKKTFYINLTSQNFVNCVASTKHKDLLLFDISKRKTRVARSASSCFYNSF